jgi:hypothetical protein
MLDCLKNQRPLFLISLSSIILPLLFANRKKIKYQNMILFSLVVHELYCGILLKQFYNEFYNKKLQCHKNGLKDNLDLVVTYATKNLSEHRTYTF